MQILKNVFLPPEVTEFEHQHLTRFHRLGLFFFAAHIPVFTLIAYFNHTGPLWALLLTALVVAGPWLANKVFTHPRYTSLVYGGAAMLMGGLVQLKITPILIA